MRFSEEIRPSVSAIPSAPAGEVDEILRSLVESISREFEAAVGNVGRVAEACRSLRDRWADPSAAPDPASLGALAGLLALRAGPVAGPVFDLLEACLPRLAEPGPILEGMLHSRDGNLARRAVALAGTRIHAGTWHLDDRFVTALADRMAHEASPFTDREALDAVAELFADEDASPESALADYFRLGDPSVQRMAARLLDRSGDPASSTISRLLLGESLFTRLEPFLAGTRAGHRDLLFLCNATQLAADLERATAECGTAPVLEAANRLGWAALADGLEVAAYIPVRVDDAFPYLIPRELLRAMPPGPGVEHGDALFLFTARGVDPEASGAATMFSERIERFRRYNLIHARLLSEFMALDPLTRPRLDRILSGMDGVVGDFVALFEDSAPDASVLADVYRMFRDRVTRTAGEESAPGGFSGEVEQLVLPFEEPRRLRDVTTLHGLKRFLHREGLRLGIRLGDASGRAGHTVALAVVGSSGTVTAMHRIAYADFDPAGGEDHEGLPYPVKLVAQEFSRYLLHGHRDLPKIRIFCYGNEAHFFISYGLHPAFVRIDFSPPSRGGIVALEFFGVSKNDLVGHPDPALGSLRTFLEALDFEVEVEGTRVRARYDKERGRHLGDLCERAASLFRLTPYLMDLDWVIGSLDLPGDARARVVLGWLQFLEEWGFLPVERLLTSNRRGILLGWERTATGERELVWSGAGNYTHRFSSSPRVRDLVGRLGPEAVSVSDLPLFTDSPDEPVGQLRLETDLLTPLTRAQTRPAPTPVDIFVDALETDDERLYVMIRLAPTAAALEREITWIEVGRVNGYPVESGNLPFPGSAWDVVVLRDAHGVIRLSWFREEQGTQAKTPAAAEYERVLGRLRRWGYLETEDVPPAGAPGPKLSEARDAFSRPNPNARPGTAPGETRISGLPAAPGRVTAPVALGRDPRSPESVEGCILVAPAVRPADNALIYRSSGVAFTGGSLLSHAGLLATQFHKPATLIPGIWARDPSGRMELILSATDFDEEVTRRGPFTLTVRRNPRRREVRLAEGDLASIDGDGGSFVVLGRDPAVLGVHAELRELDRVWTGLTRSHGPEALLALRGRRLRARHRLGRLLEQLREPAAIRYAIHELVAGTGDPQGDSDRESLLSAWLETLPSDARPRRDLVDIADEIRNRVVALGADAPTAGTPPIQLYDILAPRLVILHALHRLRAAERALESLGIPHPRGPGEDEVCSARRIRDQVGRLRDSLEDEMLGGDRTRPEKVRHRFGRHRDATLLLGFPSERESEVAAFRGQLESMDATRRELHRTEPILDETTGGLELVPLIGGKAASLGELFRLGDGLPIPPWVAVADCALRQCLAEVQVRGGQIPGETADREIPLGESISALAARTDLSFGEIARRIRFLWDEATLPESLAETITQAVNRLIESDTPMPEIVPPTSGPPDRSPRLAFRSSTLEEDTETEARAGEFETLLYVSPEAALGAVKRIWAGFWSERALHNRRVLGIEASRVGGGILVQRMVYPRASGVIHTVNMAAHVSGEMLITAGLGVGEGVVSGLVGADLITVTKDSVRPGRPLRFRYTPGDKRTQVTFDRARGSGTILTPTTYHQRFRPALEFGELRELIGIAARLESFYGIPLDIEFAVEGGRCWILQVRPLARAGSVLRETLDQFPLKPHRPPPGKELRS